MICNGENYCQVAPTPSQNAGQVLADAPESLERLQQVRLSWQGGHPGVDLPRMTLEVKSGDSWNTFTNAAGVPYSDDGFSTITWYRGDYDSDHRWEIWWEERVDFPAGTYRLHIDGHYFDGSTKKPYSLNSRPFELRPVSRMKLLEVAFDKDTLSGAVLYPPGPTNDDGTSAFSSLQPAGVLLHTPLVPPTMPWPPPADGSVKVTAVVTAPGGEKINLPAITVSTTGTANYRYVSSRDAQGGESTSTVQLPAITFSASHNAYRGAGRYVIELVAQDAFQNTGRTQLELDLN
jgi:hypothetical protein